MTEIVTKHPSGGYILEELHVGMTAETHILVTEQRIQQFADASDDYNPVHMDEAFASKTAYRGRIAHGLLTASFGSAVVGTILPGAGAIYLTQTLGFHMPVRIGETVLVRVSVKSVDPESARVELDCEGFVEDKRPIAQDPLNHDEAITMFNVVRYVRSRETYDPRALKDNFDLAQLLAKL
jgi:acyl dehydratase